MEESETNAKNSEGDLVSSTLDDHRDSMWIVADVEAVIDQHPDREGKWIGQLLEVLPRLASGMRKHFRAEEQGPLFRKLPESHPRLAQRLADLEGEHAEILKTIDEALVQAARLAESTEPYELREINAVVQLLVAKLHRHEAQENELVMEAHWSEVGVGD